ncbi:MAG: MscS Mechanosensitive ion channel, partial [Rhizorhabdus sp.]|nr:MscS Mechanosensitive ion channel [Rhizorhabdus sp.]
IVTGTDNCSLFRCVMTCFCASSLDFVLHFDVLSEDPMVNFHARHDICIAILETFAREGIEFAYPTQTTFTAAPDGRLIMPYANPAQRSSEARG